MQMGWRWRNRVRRQRKEEAAGAEGGASILPPPIRPSLSLRGPTSNSIPRFRTGGPFLFPFRSTRLPAVAPTLVLFHARGRFGESLDSSFARGPPRCVVLRALQRSLIFFLFSFSSSASPSLLLLLLLFFSSGDLPFLFSFSLGVFASISSSGLGGPHCAIPRVGIRKGGVQPAMHLLLPLLCFLSLSLPLLSFSLAPPRIHLSPTHASTRPPRRPVSPPPRSSPPRPRFRNADDPSSLDVLFRIPEGLKGVSSEGGAASRVGKGGRWGPMSGSQGGRDWGGRRRTDVAPKGGAAGSTGLEPRPPVLSVLRPALTVSRRALGWVRSVQG